MSLVGIGSILGGLGKFAGGAAGLFGSSKDKISEDNIREAMKARLYAARVFGKMYGFHPLAALGVNPGATGSWRQTRDVGKSLDRMGQGIQQAMTGKTEVDKAMAKYYNALADQINEKGVKGSGSTITEESTADSGMYTTPVKSRTISGFEAGSQALSKTARDRDGFIWKAPTEGFEDYISESFFSQMKYEGIQVWRGLKRAWHANVPWTKSALEDRRKLKVKLDQLEDALRKANKLASDEYLTWDLDRMQPKATKKNKFDKLQLFNAPKNSPFSKWRR